MAYNKDLYGEYGGVPGSIHTVADGHVELTPAEGARILRTYAIRNSDTAAGGVATVNSGVDPATGEKWIDSQQEERRLRYEDSKKRVNGYVPEDVK